MHPDHGDLVADAVMQVPGDAQPFLGHRAVHGGLPAGLGLGEPALAVRRVWRPAVLDPADDGAAPPGPAPAATGDDPGGAQHGVPAADGPGTTGTTLRTAAPTTTRSSRTGALAAVTTAAVLTWLNPHVYLDTVVLLGSVAADRGPHRWWFAAGAMTASLLWFTVLGYGARLLRPVFARPSAWRVLDAGIAVVMVALAVNLLRGA